MQLLTKKLPEKYRSPIRFVIVGTIGTFVQDGLYRLSLLILTAFFAETALVVYIAFGIGYVLETTINYFVSAFYTFGSRPNKKNAGGFVLARILNLIVQYVFLNAFIWLGLEADNAGLPAIFMAGIINFFVLKFFFKHKKQHKQ